MAETDRSTYRPTMDAYTGMLAISLLALIAGSVFLFLDYSQYHPDKKPPEIPKKALPEEKPMPPAPPQQAPPMQEEKKDDEKKDA